MQKNIKQHKEFARYYDEIFNNIPNLKLYKRYAQKTSGPILELACGTGRLSIPLAELGYKIHGLDLSRAMLNVFKKKISQNKKIKNRITLHQGNLGNFKIKEKFGLIFISNSSFFFLDSDAKKLKALNCIYEHLKDDSLCVIENFPIKRSISFTELKELDYPEGVRAWYKLDVLKTKAQDTFKIVKKIGKKKVTMKYILDLWPITVERMKEMAKKSKFRKARYFSPQQGTEKIFNSNAREVFIFKK